MTYDLVITDPAESDMIDIGLYVAQTLGSPIASQNLLNELDNHILSLEVMPKRYPLVLNSRLARLGIRSIPVKNYLIFYTVDDDAQSVVIIRVLYGKRDWASLI